MLEIKKESTYNIKLYPHGYIIYVKVIPLQLEL